MSAQSLQGPPSKFQVWVRHLRKNPTDENCVVCGAWLAPYVPGLVMYTLPEPPDGTGVNRMVFSQALPRSRWIVDCCPVESSDRALAQVPAS